MRVALVIERFLPSGGGMESVAWNVAHGLVRAGEEVHVLCREAAATDACRIREIRVASRWQPIRVLSFARRTARLVAGERFDVVHAFSRTLAQDLYRAGGGSHADYMDRAYPPLGRTLRRLTPRHALLLSLERRIFAQTPFIQCGSRMVRDEIERRFRVPRERLRVVYNGVDCERFSPDRSKDRPADLPARGDGPTLLFAGSGWRRKGLDTAMRALSLAAGRSARLWVAGRDTPDVWRALAQQLGVAERVDFLGPRRDVECVYAAADALVLPSRYDAFANVCLEAAATGLPVVTAGTNGSSELFHDAGFVIDDPEDAQGFADAIDRLADASLRASLGQAARKRALGLTWDAHVTALRALYAEVAA